MKTMQPTAPTATPAWLRRLGIGGFCFFLAKGLLWLAVPAALATLGAAE